MKSEGLPALNDYLTYLASERGASPHTIEAYQRDILYFLGFQNIQLVNLNQSHLVSYMGYLNNLGYAASSISRAINAIKSFLKFCKREEIVTKNVGIYLDTPKLWQSLPTILSQEEMIHLIKSPDTKTELGARDRAILEVLYSTGVRVSELCQLNLLSLKGSFIRVMGKGSKERVVPIGMYAIEAINFYLGRFRNCMQKALFINRQGSRIKRTEVGVLVKKYAKRAGIKKNVYPHLFRHTFASHLLEHGADLRVLQEMLGHSTIASTARYTHISCSQLRKTFAAFHPRYE